MTSDAAALMIPPAERGSFQDPVGMIPDRGMRRPLLCPAGLALCWTGGSLYQVDRESKWTATGSPGSPGSSITPSSG